MENGLYYDPNAYIKRYATVEKPKVDLMHIEKVVYPVDYENFSTRYDKSQFKEKTHEENTQKSNLDFSKLLPLLTNKGNLNALLPNLLSNLGMNKDIMQLLSGFNGVKKQNVNKKQEYSKDSISKYKKVK